MIMNRRNTIFPFVLLILSATILLGIGAAQAASVTIQVPSIEANADSEVDVPIHVTGASGIGAMQLDVLYDPSILSLETVTSGPLLGSNALLEFDSNTVGRLMMAMVTIDGMNGDDTIATVRFKVLGEEGQKSALTLENAYAWEGSTHHDIIVQTEPGQIMVTGSSSSSILWIVIILAGLLLLVVLVIWWRVAARKSNAA